MGLYEPQRWKIRRLTFMALHLWKIYAVHSSFSDYIIHTAKIHKHTVFFIIKCQFWLHKKKTLRNQTNKQTTKASQTLTHVRHLFIIYALGLWYVMCLCVYSRTKAYAGNNKILIKVCLLNTHVHG